MGIRNGCRFMRHVCHDAYGGRVPIRCYAPRRQRRGDVALVDSCKMTLKDDPTLEDALDGLQNAEKYCQESGLGEYTRLLARLYQEIGSDAPDEDWEAMDDGR